MTSNTFLPSPQLRPYIDSYTFVNIQWNEMDKTADVWRLIPSGQASMLFVYGDKHLYSVEGANEGLRQTIPTFVVGQQTRPIWLKFSGHTQLLKVQFRPNGLSHLLPLEMNEITGQPAINLQDIWGTTVADFLDQIAGSAHPEKSVAMSNHFFESKLLPLSKVDYIDYTLDQLHAGHGNSSIRTINQKLGITCRHLERLFRARVGLSPKEYGRIIRLNYALHRIRETDNSLTRISYESGYFDQAHFTRDFRSIAGVTPSRLLTGNTPEVFVTKGRCFVA